ncbi:MAG: malonyl-ACP O-methyltransferase BioC [Methylomonas sp.]|nr:malonyl-ACP O-methyltransferase BioC [Methylomonas sp.]
MTIETGLDKGKIRRAFAAAASGYDGAAALQRKVGLELLRRFPLGRKSGRVLDVGCGTGFLTCLLDTALAGQQLIALDLALPMLQTSRSKQPDMEAYYLCADAEKLPLARSCVSQIYSNLALQWTQDLATTFSGFKQVLEPGGVLVFATFGPATLCELKSAWAAVDSYTHVNTFHSVAAIDALLSAAGFRDIRVSSLMYRWSYPTVLDLMRELKDMGAHNVNSGRKPKPTTKAQLQQMMIHYREQMPGLDIVASYEIIFVKARL